ncbi:formimidoylglutamase [Bacillus timonensis]|nr:formimidoylglutamase [Bacillus timonensis]
MTKLPYIKQAGQAIFQDRFVKKANELLISADARNDSRFILVGAPLSKSSISHSGASFAPATIRKMLSSYSTYAIEENIELENEEIVDVGDIVMHPTDIVQSQKRIEDTVSELLEVHQTKQLILLGGDHSVSFPAIKAFAGGKRRVGVIQFDAHHDLRNLEDGGPTNGTPFRSLLESGSLKGEHLIQIGIRNFANGKAYSSYGKEQGVSIYTMKDVREQSLSLIVKEAIRKLENEVDVIYLSVDVDVLDQAFAPGCPAIGPGGMSSEELLNAILFLAQHDKVQGMDIVEIDPTLDFRDMTSRVAAWIILNFILGKRM